MDTPLYAESIETCYKLVLELVIILVARVWLFIVVMSSIAIFRWFWRCICAASKRAAWRRVIGVCEMAR